MNNNQIVTALFDAVQNNNLDIAGADKKFYTKLVLHASEIRDLYTQLYSNHPAYHENFTRLIEVLIASHQKRPQELRDRDNRKHENWYLSNELAGMSLYIDRFNKDLAGLHDKLDYLQELGISLLHLLGFSEKKEPIFNGDYAVSDSQQIFESLGTLEDLAQLRKTMHEKGMSLMLDLGHNFKQEDTDYTDPGAFVDMLDNVLFYANLGVDILQIDASTFPQTHTVLQLIRQCVQVTASGMALSGKAIEGPADMMKYFGEGRYLAKECDFTYNATQMALQWDALASGRVSMMMAAQTVLAEKPYGTTWITYTRNHNDISLDFDDSMILESGFTPHAHREYLKDFFSGTFPGSTASGAIFHANGGTPEARISGTLASLCGLEKAINEKNEHQISISIQKILLMQANSFFAGGMPMLFYGDETGYLNDYSFQKTDKIHDNRWMHKPLIDWKKNKLARQEGTIENMIYSGTKKLLSIRAKLAVVADVNNTRWLPRHNIHIAGFVRNGREKALFCIFNYSNESAYLTWHSFRYNGFQPQKLYDHWSDNYFEPGNDADFLILEPYAFYLLEVIS